MLRRNSQKSSRLLYGLGSLGEGMAFNMFYIYFSFFLTTVAGLDPALTGTVSFVAILIGIGADLFFGELADSYRGSKDIKYNMLMWGAIPLGLTMLLMFTDFPISNGAKAAGYLCLNILFWLFLSMTDNNYLAMGAELSNDYDERTKLRSWATFFLNIAAAIVGSGIILLVNGLIELTSDTVASWNIVGAITGLVTALCFLLAGLGMRGRPAAVLQKNRTPAHPLKGLFNLMKVKQYRIVIAISCVYNIFVGLLDTSLLYLFLYAYKLSDEQYSLMMLVSALLISAAAIPVGAITVKFGKKRIAILGFACLVAAAIVRLIGSGGIINAFLTTTLVGLCGTVFWSAIIAMVYDTVELDQLINGKKREGLLVSVNNMITKFGAAVGLWIAGSAYSLMHVNFGEEGNLTASANSVWWFVTLATAATGIICIVLVATYKIDRRTHSTIKKALEAAGEEKAELVKQLDRIL